MEMHESEYTSLLNRLEYLKKVRRIEIADALRFATELGDLRENAEYDAACQDYQDVEREIYQLEQELKNVKVVSKVDTNIVTIGCTVILDFDGEEETYVVRNSSHIDGNSISATSCLGQAIMNHKVGDIITVDSPIGTYSVKIKNIF